MTLDIIIPTLNEYNNIKRLLPYLQTHLDSNSKIFIVDSHESDDELIQLCTESNVLYIKSEITNRAIQLNLGAQKSTADILHFLHADVIPPENFVKEINKVISEGFEAGIFAYDFISSKLLLKVNSWFTRYHNPFAGGGDQGQFYLRKVFNQLGGYDPDAIIMEDFYLYHKMKSKGHKHTIIQNPMKVSARKFHQNNWFKVNLVSFIVFVMYWFGTSPDKLKNTYNRFLR